MRVLGDINPRSTASFESSAHGEATRDSETPRQRDQSWGQISDIPLKLTDERYRVECERLREDEALQAIRVKPASSFSTPVSRTAVEEPEEPDLHRADDHSGIDDAPIDLGSVSNDLTQEQRERAANQLFSSFGYVKVSPRPRTRKGAPWTLVLVLVLALAALAGYGYLAMRHNGVSARELPGVAAAITLDHSLESVRARASADLQAARERSDHLVASGRERWARWRR